MDFLISTLLAGLALLLSHQTPSTLYQSIAHDIADKTPVVSQSEIAHTITHSAPSIEQSYPTTKPEPVAPVSAAPALVSQPTKNIVKQPVINTIKSVKVVKPAAAVKGFEKAQVQIGPNPSARIIDLDQPAEDVDRVHRSLSRQDQEKADQELSILLGSLGFNTK